MSRVVLITGREIRAARGATRATNFVETTSAGAFSSLLPFLIFNRAFAGEFFFNGENSGGEHGEFNLVEIMRRVLVIIFRSLF